MWARMARGLRRMALLIPLALTALALFLLPRPSTLRLPFTLGKYGSPTPFTDDQALAKEPVISLSETVEEEKETGTQSVTKTQRLWFMTSGVKRPNAKPWNWNPMEAKLFPEDAPSEDRIIDQLMFTIPKREAHKMGIKKILLPNGLGTWSVSSGRTEFIRNRCPVDKCTLTVDTQDAATADAILFKDHFVPFNVKRPLNQIWILYYLECPYHTFALRPSHVHMFNWTATYRRDSDIVAPYERWVYHDPKITERVLDRNYAANKTKKVAWFVSNCHARNQRLQYARALSKYISVDIYGTCGTHHCPRSDPYCLEMLNRDYKFYLAFENSNCKDYITEKFFVNGLSHDVLPIVMGAPPAAYAAVAPHNSYVHVEEFAGPEELAAYLHRLDEDDTLYNSYFKWKGTGEFINTFFFCRLCAMVHANEIRHRNAHYTDVQSWWRTNTCTQGQWRSMADDNG